MAQWAAPQMEMLDRLSHGRRLASDKLFDPGESVLDLLTGQHGATAQRPCER